ncbi:MAG: sigma-70 family RNA polymerase sigma factor [Planctomycetes bacterium]|nr:sigma-70 family RNA polymerase sigma factor [Planctomycetota bacterium]
MDSNASERDKQHHDWFEVLLVEAQDGSAEAVGKLLQDCRAYLLLIANQELESGLVPKAGASDLVQESMLSAQRCIGDFRGKSRDELLAWLRGILLNDIKETRRRFRTAGRDVFREQGIDVGSVRLRAEQVAAAHATPATDAIAHEEADRLQAALDCLASDDREVIMLRNWQQLSFVDIGKRMGRSTEAARKLWSRAIIRLQDELERCSE